MFRPLSLWQQVPCPALEARGSCTVTHCLFSHNLPSSQPVITEPPTPPTPPNLYAGPRTQKILDTSVKHTGIEGDAPIQSGDPRLRKIIESNLGSDGNGEEKRENKRRRLSDSGDSASSSSTGNGGVLLMNSPAPTKRTKTKVETAGSAVIGPKSILKKKVAVTQKALPVPKATTASPKTAASGGNAKTPLPSAISVPKSNANPRPGQDAVQTPVKQEKPLTLNPRLVPVSPAIHGTRLQLLTLLHKEYVRLHENNGDPQEILRLALDEEEKVAREMKSIYTQAMKKRIVKLQKTSIADYNKEKEETRKRAAREEEERKRTLMIHGVLVDNGMDNSKPPLITGLSPIEELNALRTLLQPREALGKYGYILEPPTIEDVKTAERGIEAAGGWESCDRCNTRFQVFDGRRESDGRLASGGKCVYHWGKATWPPRSSTSFTNDKIFTCCRQKVGQSTGCVTCENHVYKVSEAKRLAAIWQFVETQGGLETQLSTEEGEEGEPKIEPIERAICLDCEMCYTTLGMELIRITATAFPSGEVVVDALVRPRGGILDLNSRYSGVFPKHIMEALPYSRNPYPPTPVSQGSFINPSLAPSNDVEDKLTILPSPEEARSLLISYIDSKTPILGHALENDLNALRLCHRSIIDTAIMFPHNRGFPARNKLKWLVEKYLERKIQVDGDSPQGHDSKIDARCAGELVRWKIKDEEAKRKRYRGGAMMAVGMKVLKCNVDDHNQDMDTDKESGGVLL